MAALMVVQLAANWGWRKVVWKVASMVDSKEILKVVNLDENWVGWKVFWMVGRTVELLGDRRVEM